MPFFCNPSEGTTSKPDIDCSTGVVLRFETTRHDTTAHVPTVDQGTGLRSRLRRVGSDGGNAIFGRALRQRSALMLVTTVHAKLCRRVSIRPSNASSIRAARASSQCRIGLPYPRTLPAPFVPTRASAPDWVETPRHDFPTRERADARKRFTAGQRPSELRPSGRPRFGDGSAHRHAILDHAVRGSRRPH